MRELSSLVGLQVIATDEGRRLGTVADALVDLSAGELVAVTLAQTPELRLILADDIDVIGSDALMIAGSDRVKSRDEAADAVARGRRVLAEPPQVITTQGHELGRLGAVHVEEGSCRIVRFEVPTGTLRDVTEGVLALPVMEGIIHGEDTVIVPHEVVARRLAGGGGLRGTFRSLARRLRAGVAEVGERSEQLEEKLKAGAQKAREKADKVAREARETTDKLADQAKEAVEEATKSEEEEEPGGESEKQGEEGTEIVPGPATPLPGEPEDEASPDPDEAADERSE